MIILLKNLISYLAEKGSAIENDSKIKLDDEIKIKREKINYIILQLDYHNKFRINIKQLLLFIIPLFGLEIFLYYSSNENMNRVLESLAAPLVIGALILYYEYKVTSYEMALGYENELFDLLTYIFQNDKLKENETYLLNYIYTNKEKYTRKNKFDLSKAKYKDAE